jgi:xanthine/uracil/vitamin C permease (AzgA family)
VSHSITETEGVTRFLVAGGTLATLMGAALILPVVAARIESGAVSPIAIGVIAVSCGLIACGMTAVVVSFRQPNRSIMPSGVRSAVAANVLFLAFFALELSDRLVRQDGRIVYWSTFLFLPALLLFYGLLTARPLAWWTFRGAAALGVVWFLGFVAIIPFVNLQREGVPVPWQGRVYMACVSLVFAGILAGAFWSLGRAETRNYFRLAGIKRNAIV